MKEVAIAKATHPDIKSQPRSSDREHLTAALKRWRKRLGYFSVLTAVPAIMGWQAPETRADTLTTPTVPVPGQAEGRQTRLISSYIKPKFLQRQNNYFLPHQNMRPSTASVLSGGGDNCPGAAIPIGPYSGAAPFTDTGDTTGANDTINYLYYGYWPLSGPDHIYSFTLTARGPAAEIRVTPTSAVYDPAIYILDSRGGCPAGTGNTGYWWTGFSNAAGPGGAEILDSSAINNLPLNVPLHLFIDARAFDNSGPYTLKMQDVTVASGSRTKFDFDGNTYADFSVFRPSNGVWYRLTYNNGVPSFTGIPFGTATDKPVPADYDGDGRTDIAIYRDGIWWWIDSSNNAVHAVQFGIATDTPIPADFTGDGRAELAVYRDGEWWTYNRANGQVASAQFGLATDKPVVGDYDGDGLADRAVFRDGIWYIDRSAQGFAALRWGLPSDKLVSADYDGDGRVDPAIYRDGDWWILGSASGIMHVSLGTATDIPAPADYNGDGLVDSAVYHDGTWYIHNTWGDSTTSFGLPTDKPIPSAYNR